MAEGNHYSTEEPAMEINRQDDQDRLDDVDESGTRDRGLVQDVRQEVNAMIEVNYEDDEQMEALLAAATKERGELKERTERQHKELVALRQKMAKEELELEQQDEWNATMSRRVDEAAAEIEQAERECNLLAAANARYVRDRTKVLQRAQYTHELFEKAKQKMDSRVAKDQREIEELERTFKEEEAMTRALLQEKDEDEEEYRKMKEEKDRQEEEDREYERKYELELVRQKEIRSRIAECKKQLAIIEENKKKNDKLEEEVNKKLQKKKDMTVLLNTLQKKKEEIDRRKKDNKDRLEAGKARYNAELQKNLAKMEKLKKCENKRAAIRKELENGIKDLVVSKHESEVKQAEMRRRKLDLEGRIRQEEREILDLRKSIEAKNKKKSDREKRKKEIAEVEQKALLTKTKIDSAMGKLAQLQKELECTVGSLQKNRDEIEERRNMHAKEELEYDDLLQEETIKIEELSSRLREEEEKISCLLAHQSVLVFEWESQHYKIGQIIKQQREKNAIASRKNCSMAAKEEIARMEELKQMLREQIQTVQEKCFIAERQRDSLKSQIEELRASLRNDEAKLKSEQETNASIQSAIESTEAQLVAIQKRIADKKETRDKAKEMANSLKAEKAVLKAEILSLPDSTTLDTRNLWLREQIEECDRKIEATKKNTEELVSEEKEIAKEMKELQKAENSRAKAREKELSSLERRAAETKEEIDVNERRLENFGRMVDENKQKCADKAKRLEEAKKSLETEKNEVVNLRKHIEKMKTEAPIKEAEQKAELEELEKQIEDIKKKEEVGTLAFQEKEEILVEKVKKAQHEYKRLLGQKPPSPKCSSQPPPLSRRKQMMILSSEKNADNFGGDMSSLAGLTQRSAADRSPSSSSSVSSVELTKEDWQAIRAGKTTTLKLVSERKAALKKSKSQE